MTDIGPRRVPWDDFLAMHLREIGLAVLAIVALLCGLAYVELPGGTELAGSVTSGGKPVVYGTVTVVASDNRVYTAPIGPDGTYRIKALPPGPVRVAVSSPNPKSVMDQTAAGESPDAAPSQPSPAAAPRTATADGAAAKPDPKAAAEPVSVAAPNGSAPPFPASVPPPRQQAQQQGWFRIPGRYANPTTSGIGTEVQRGRTPLDLKLD